MAALLHCTAGSLGRGWSLTMHAFTASATARCEQVPCWRAAHLGGGAAAGMSACLRQCASTVPWALLAPWTSNSAILCHAMLCHAMLCCAMCRGAGHAEPQLHGQDAAAAGGWASLQLSSAVRRRPASARPAGPWAARAKLRAGFRHALCQGAELRHSARAAVVAAAPRELYRPSASEAFVYLGRPGAGQHPTVRAHSPGV